MKSQFRTPAAPMVGISNWYLMFMIFIALIGIVNCCQGQSVERAILNADNWDQLVPSGKEVDAIYGDIVIHNVKIVAVIAQPSAKRHANMTVRNVGGSLIDLTLKAQPNDQLSCFYPGSDQLLFHNEDGVRFATTRGTDGTAISEEIVIEGKTSNGGLPATVTYRLDSGDDFLRVTSSILNNSNSKFALRLPDSVRADRTFKTRVSDDGRLVAFYDPSFHQAYGIVGSGDFEQLVFPKPNNGRKKIWTYRNETDEPQEVLPGDSIQWERFVFPAKNGLELDVIADQIRVAEGVRIERVATEFLVRDTTGPVNDATVTIRQNGKSIGFARTDHTGKLVANLAPKPGRWRKRGWNRSRSNVKLHAFRSSSNSGAGSTRRKLGGNWQARPGKKCPLACKTTPGTRLHVGDGGNV